MPKKIEPKFVDIKEEIENITNTILKKFFQKKTEYIEKEAQGWSKALVEEITKKLSSTFKEGYKFITNATIVEKEAGLHYESSAFWNSNTDGTVEAFYENEEIYAYVNVFTILQFY